MSNIGYQSNHQIKNNMAIIAIKNKEELIKRIKTFAWSLFWVARAAVADHTLTNLGVLNLPTITISGAPVDTAIILGLVLNQISKFARNKRLAK